MISCGGVHNLYASAGFCWSWGWNENGQLGTGHTLNLALPHKISLPITVTFVSCGWRSSFAVGSDGSLWSWGINKHGQLGHGHRKDLSSPKQITSLTNVISVSSGSGSTLALTSDGELWSWGENNDGQLGLGHCKECLSPVLVPIQQNIKQISCGSHHCGLVTESGNIWVWGRNRSGQLGLNDLKNRSSPVIGLIQDAKLISCGKDSTIVLNNQGELWSCGDNMYGQLGLGSKSDPVILFTKITTDITFVNVVCAFGNCIAVDFQGQIWCWGRNDSHQLGAGHSHDIVSPFHLKSNHIQRTIDVNAGINHIIVMDENNKLFSCGYDIDGELGCRDRKGHRSLVEVDFSNEINATE